MTSIPAISVSRAPGLPALPTVHRATLELTITGASLAMLVVASLEGTPVARLATLLWLGSVVVLTFMNVGAAFGVYVAAAAVFGVRSFGAWGTLYQRPDNYALLLLLGILLLVRVRLEINAFLRDKTVLLAFALAVYGLLHSVVFLGTIPRPVFAHYMRMFGLPLVAFAFLMQCRLTRREIRALAFALVVLGLYMAVVSLLERLGWYHLILPPWVGDPEVSKALGKRSGGLMLQAEWNGLALGLALLLLLTPQERRREEGWRPTTVLGVALLLAAIFVTYTRAAWLAVIVSLPVLFLAKGSSVLQTRARRLAFGFGLVVATAAILAAPKDTASQRLGNQGTIEYRQNLWVAAANMALDRPLLGHGYGEFQTGFADYQVETSLFPYRELGSGRKGVHNTTLAVLTELGLVGLALYWLVLIALYRRCRTKTTAWWGREGTLWLIAFFLMYHVQVQFIVAHMNTTNMMFYGVLGALAGLRLGGPSRALEWTSEGTESSQQSQPRLAGVG